MARKGWLYRFMYLFIEKWVVMKIWRTKILKNGEAEDDGLESTKDTERARKKNCR